MSPPSVSAPWSSPAIYALSDVKVGGPLYDKIKLGNDLVADILPPPEYVIESYLEATLALQQSGSTRGTRRDRLIQLKKEYDERREFWSKSDLDPAIKSKLIEDSHREVQRFWTAIEQVFLPALAKGDATPQRNPMRRSPRPISLIAP